MSYIQPNFSESGMTTQNKVDALNILETQCSEAITYIDSVLHDSTYYTKTLADSTFYRTASHPSGRSDTGHGCGIDAITVDGYTKQDLLNRAVPTGSIAVWTLSADSIPTPWGLCNGESGKPDIRGRILIGAGAGYNAGSTGGYSTQSPTAPTFDTTAIALTTNQIPRHTHNYSDTYNTTATWGAGTASYDAPTSHNDSTTGVNGTPNTSCATHFHAGCTFTWNGYYDDADVYHTGSLSILPPFKAYCYIIKL